MDRSRFMGRMAAAISHDLCNVLATIQQASGLMEDFLNLARKESLKSMGLRPKFKYHDKFQDIIGQVQSQVGRGQDMCEKLSILAHSADEDQGPADLGVALAVVTGFCGRAARKHKLTLELAPSTQRLPVHGCLIDVLSALEAAMLGVMWNCREQGAVSLTTGRTDGTVHVDIRCPALQPAEAQSLAATLSARRDGPYTIEQIQCGLRLAFPEAGREA